LRARKLHFSAEIPCYRGFSLLIDFLGSAVGSVFAENGGIQGFSGIFPVKLTGNFFARNREYDSAEQGIHFRGTGNSKRRNRNLRYERRDCAPRLQQQRENRRNLQR
jgi:hypothetical protein